MKKIILPIDTKSLYLNIKNDNLSGHTATVATPLKQGNSYNNELSKLLNIKEKEYDFGANNGLINELLKNSKSKIKIRNVFLFDKISVNGVNIDTDKKYCIFIKEEVDPQKAQYGRLKIHYPISLKYSDVDIDIDNKSIIYKISQQLKNYAFIIKSFEYDICSKVLNFNALIVGENRIPYSKVFVNEKGVGNKFNKIFNENADDYDMEIINLKKYISKDIDPVNYAENCLVLKNISKELITNYLAEKGANDISFVSEEYPYSLYDVRYRINNDINYLITSWTTTKIKYFNLSSKRNVFCHDFPNLVKVLVISDILGDKTINEYTINEIDRLNKVITSLKYIDEGEKYE